MKIILTDDRDPSTGSAAAGSASDPPPVDGSDEELWEQLRAGDHFALGELFDRYADDVRAFAFRRTASWSTADDVVQATFLSTWRRFERNPPGPLTGSSARGWLLVVAGNECRTLARTAARLRNLVDRLPEPSPDDDHAPDVARRLDDELRMSAIRRAVAKLPRHERETLELVVWSGLTTAEAADALGVPVGTVKARLHRTRRRFPDLLTRVDLTEELS
ncbi:RNA polymerase sigma-70 factor (ECF subfamily) [Kribbella pratensis]|uniref:RNA polymerase sigma-70 factor (ECF subfamily) n=1 Tax=Kribbella pratensis TaxID=2512112 RepID=A0ABY2FIL0_9ACTN|nr:RNA polymerase sigma factor [Kribbella pratensis]TDW92955.1 RNA polymerase sigma-70 factor (ECF subfamily) [Kribbella pratensis]